MDIDKRELLEDQSTSSLIAFREAIESLLACREEHGPSFRRHRLPREEDAVTDGQIVATPSGFKHYESVKAAEPWAKLTKIQVSELAAT